ncbi:MAG: hypothetical protein ABIQ04_00965 [Candidatus Saccharimonadales bacterium]
MTSPGFMDGLPPSDRQPYSPVGDMESLLASQTDVSPEHRLLLEQIHQAEAIILASLHATGFDISRIEALLLRLKPGAVIGELFILLDLEAENCVGQSHGDKNVDDRYAALEAMYSELSLIQKIALATCHNTRPPDIEDTTKMDIQCQIYLDQTVGSEKQQQMIVVTEQLLPGPSLSFDDPSSFTFIDKKREQTQMILDRIQVKTVLSIEVRVALQKIIEMRQICFHDDLEMLIECITYCTVMDLLDTNEPNNIAQQYDCAVKTARRIGWTDGEVDQILQEIFDYFDEH